MEKANRTKELPQQPSDANDDINYTNKSLDLLRKVKQEEQRHFQNTGKDGRGYSGEPRLSSFYRPGPEMKKYEFWLPNTQIHLKE